MAWRLTLAAALVGALLASVGPAPTASAAPLILRASSGGAPACAGPKEPRGERAGCGKGHDSPPPRRVPGKTAGATAPAPAPDKGASTPDAQPAQDPRKDGYADPFGTLGARSPFCPRARIGTRASENCRLSGAIEHPYPLSSYGLDVRVGFSLTKVENNLLGALQSVAALVWMGLVYLLKGVLLLLEWAFSLDLIGDSLPGVRQALRTLHERVLGEPWFLAAVSVAGLWGIWRGLVQRKTIETLGGLGATVLLMVAALVLIANPAGTVGYASRLANDGALGLLSAASSGRVKEPAESYSDAMRGLYDSLVLQPWCALEFGDVDWCLAHPKNERSLTNADLWLSFPTQSGQRESLYKLTKGESLEGGILGSAISFGDLLGSAREVATGGPLGQALGIGRLGKEALKGQDAKLSDRVKGLVHDDPERVRMQEGGGTFPRIALVVLIAAGMLGAIALLLYIGVRLLLAAILSLLLLLLAPAMLLAPAFGDSGRATFVAWAKRLLGALAAKLIFALLLALVLVAASAIAALRIGWFGTWLLQLAFWWGVLLKRKDLVGLVSVGRGGVVHHTAQGARRLYRDARATGFALGSARRGASKVAGAPVLALARVGHERGEDRRSAVRSAAGEELAGRAEETLGLQLQGGRATLARNEALDRELRDTNRGLAKYDTAVQVAKQRGDALPTPSPDEEALLARRAVLEQSKDRPEALNQAQSIVASADRNLSIRGARFTDADRAALVAQRRRDIDSELPLDHERNLRFAGVDPRVYGRAPAEEQARMRALAAEAIERDRRLLAALPEPDRPAPAVSQLKRATVELPPERLRARVGERREIRAQERRLRRRRERLYRRP